MHYFIYVSLRFLILLGTSVIMEWYYYNLNCCQFYLSVRQRQTRVNEWMDGWRESTANVIPMHLDFN